MMFLQGLGAIQRLDMSLNGLSSIPLGLMDELQSLRSANYINASLITPTK